MLKKRGVLKWKKVSDRQLFVSSIFAIQTNSRLRKFFNSWYDCREQLREKKSLFVMQTELNKRFHFRRVLTALRIHTEEKLHTKNIIRVFQQKHNMVEKARVFSGIVTQNYEDKLTMRDFIKRIFQHSQNRLADAFTVWRKNLKVARNDDLAGLFYEKRAVKFMLRKYFDKLLVQRSCNAKKDMKSAWLNKVRNN